MLFVPLAIMCIFAVVVMVLVALFVPDGSSSHALEDRLARRAEDRAANAAPAPAASA